MKKLFGILISLYFVYFVVEYVLFRFSKGQVNFYTIVNDSGNYRVNEVFVSNEENNDEFYSFSINDHFYFRIYDDLKRRNKVISDIKHYQDETYECIYPIFRTEDVYIDVLCKQENRFIFYNNIKGSNPALDNFVKSISSYPSNLFKENVTTQNKINLATVYPENLDKNMHIALTNYKGIYHLAKTDSKEISLFSNDVYDNTIHTVVKQYFVTANYNLEHQFSSFFVINLNNNAETEINYNGTFSFDSYIQGVVNDSFYLFDPTNKTQYKITPKRKKIEITSENGTLDYFNGKEFVKKKIQEALSTKMIFKFDGIENETTLVSKGEKSGYRYILNNKGSMIEVTRKSINNDYDLTYLFSCNEVRNVSFYKDIMFFIDGSDIKMYSDKTGLRTLASMSELTFNKKLNYYIYVK